MIPDGYSDLAPGKIASVVTYLEMVSRPPISDAASSEVQILRVKNPDLDWYLMRYRQAGAQWLWFSRLDMGSAELTTILHRSTTELLVAENDGKEIGLAELDRSQPPDVEIRSFALFPDAIGKGLGRAFMTELLKLAWDASTERVWLHTCTLDSPVALAFYMKCGFRPYKRAIEVSDDPRIRGILAEGDGPQVPIIR